MLELLLVLVALGAVVVFFVVTRKSSSRVNFLEQQQVALEVKERQQAERADAAIRDAQDVRVKLEQAEMQIRVLIEQRAKAEQQIESVSAQAEEERVRMSKVQETFREEFRNMASDIMEQKSRQFKESNKQEMEVIIKPLRDNIVDFKHRVEQIYSDENQQRGALKSELKNLLDLNKKITEETSNLTNALKGNSKVQGDWGEMILETILDSSSLVNGIHYFTQQSFTDEEGNRLRPDVVLNLPDSKQIVIDSKVSLTAFVNYTGSDDHEQRKRHMADHISSVRRHVDELGSKKYQNLVNSPDFVIMFIPNEPAFLAVLQSDADVWQSAYNKRVIISSPTNLFALLKIVDDLWKRDSQSKNAIEIARQGADLYDKFILLLESVNALGGNLDKASQSYDKILKQLKSGSGNLIGRAEKIRKLGIKAQKNLPSQFSDFEQDDDRMIE